MSRRPVCAACLEPAPDDPVRCRDCGASYHPGCRSGACLVPGCTPRRAPTPAVAPPIGWCWWLARWTGVAAAFGWAWLWLRSDSWRFREIWSALLVAGIGSVAAVFFVWLGCVLDYFSGALAGRRYGTLGLWLLATCSAVSVPTVNAFPPIAALAFGGAVLGGLGCGAYGIARDRLQTRAALALAAGLLLGGWAVFVYMAGW